MGALLYGLLASGEKQDWADGDMTGLLEVEKEKNEFYSYNEKDYSYGATGTNGQVMGVSKALVLTFICSINLITRLKIITKRKKSIMKKNKKPSEAE